MRAGLLAIIRVSTLHCDTRISRLHNVHHSVFLLVDVMDWPMGCIDDAPAVGSTSFEGPNSWRAPLIDTSTNRSNGSTSTQNCSFFSGSTTNINATCAGFRWAFAAPQELCCRCGGGTTLISRGGEDDGSLAGLTVGVVLGGLALLLCIVLATWYVRGCRGPSSVGGPTPSVGGPSFDDATKSDVDGMDTNDLNGNVDGNVEQRGERNVLSPATPRTIAGRIARVTRNSVRRSASTITASKPSIVEVPKPSSSGPLLSPEIQGSRRGSRGPRGDHSDDEQDDEQDPVHDDGSSTPSMYSTVSIQARHGSFSPCGAQHSLHSRMAKATTKASTKATISQFTLDELLVSGSGQWPGIDELLTVQLNESPQDRLRRLEWIRYLVSQDKPQKAYELGWDGKRFLTADLGARGDRWVKYPWSDLSVVAELGIERALAMEARMHPRARTPNALFQGDDDHVHDDGSSSVSSSAPSTPSMYSTVSIQARHGSFSPCGAHSHSRRLASKAKNASSDRLLLSLQASIGQFTFEESTRAPPQESWEPSLQPCSPAALANKSDSGIIPRPSTPGTCTAAFVKDEDKALKVDEVVGTPARAPASTPASGRKLRAKSSPFWELRAEKDARKPDKRGRKKLSPRSEAILQLPDDDDDDDDVERRSKSFDVARKWTLSMEAKVYDEESEDSEEKERSITSTASCTCAPRGEATLEQFMNRLEARTRPFVIVDSLQPSLLDL